MMQASQQKHEVTSLNKLESESTFNKIANNHETTNNQNGDNQSNNQRTIVDKDSEIDRQEIDNKIEDIAVNGEAVIERQHTNNKMETKTEGKRNQTAKDKEGENIQKEDTSVENTTEERNIKKGDITAANRNIEQASIVKENATEVKVKNISADEGNDTKKEATEERFVVENQNKDNRINITKNERSLSQRKIVSNTDVGIETKETIDELKDAEKLSEVSDLSDEHDGGRKDFEENMSDKSTRDTVINHKIIFQNRDTGLVSGAGQEDFGSDDSDSEISSSEETESSDESSDSHVPISCKDFDNALETYLKDNVGGSSHIGRNDLEGGFQTLDPTVGKDATNNWNQVDASNNEIYANETRLPNDMYPKKSHIFKESEDGKPIEAQGSVVYANESRTLPTAQNPGESPKSQIPKHANHFSEPSGSQENGTYASEPHRNFVTETNNGPNSEETMFYGATSDDVTAYMAALPAEWTNTWYRVYERQTNFLLKYTKFCQENF